MKRALFLDRDGTLVEPRHYPSTPSDLVLQPGIGPLLRMFAAAGWELVVVTNQSGLARGYFTEEALERMHDRLREMLRVWGVELHAIYACPHHIEGIVPHLAVHCRCRKPQPGMLLEAAEDRGIDLSRSWMVGDILDDVEAGNRAGCRTVLVDLGTEGVPDRPERWPRLVARSTADALRQIAFAEELLPPQALPVPSRTSLWSSAVAARR
ncbi:MAG: HAD family hydrolase [Thermomicrobiales bacterium]|nr:HAD family hydrolase [Thermomicrobiales bacterium]